MKNDPLKDQEKIFDQAQKKFDDAAHEYLKAVKAYKVFTSSDLLDSASNLMRAAYSDRMAWILAEMSNLAYIEFERSAEESARLELNLKSGFFELVKTFSTGGTQAFLARNDSYAVLAFRGTEFQKIEDIRTDIRVYKQNTKDGKVHAGFQNGYDIVAKEIEACLIDKNKEKWPLYVTGHSMGGALAAVATQNLDKIMSDQICACYTFGSPRVGNADYHLSIKAPIYRVVNSTDIVSLVPTIGYYHVGDTRFINRRGNVYLGIPFFSRGWEMLLALFSPSRWVDSHRMEEYCSKLEAYALKRNPNLSHSRF